MMTDELIAFWGAIAQLIPVLAIPLVIEARTLARRISANADEFKRRSLRVRWGVTYIVLGGAMASIEFTALASLALGESSEWQIYAALAVLLLAFYVVFSIPVTAIGEALVRDATWVMALRAPWGKAKRGRRKARRLLARVHRSRDTMERRRRELQPMMDMISGDPEADQKLRGIYDQNLAMANRHTREGRRARRFLSETQVIFGPETAPNSAGLARVLDESTTVFEENAANARLIIAQYDEMISGGAPEEAVEALRQQTARLGEALP